MLTFGDRERRDHSGQALGHAAGPASAVGSCAIAPVFSAFAVIGVIPVALRVERVPGTRRTAPTNCCAPVPASCPS
jgi:hypothetical protein